jgi:hypothetical protein
MSNAIGSKARIEPDPLVEAALATLRVVAQRMKIYGDLDTVIQDVPPNLPGHQHCMDEKVERAVVDLLDKILGFEIASYFLYRCQRGSRGKIQVDGRSWPIRSICSTRLNDSFPVQYGADRVKRIDPPSCCGTNDGSNAGE